MKSNIFLFILLAILCGIVHAEPPINFDRKEKNVFGGYNYYKNNKMVGRGHKNNTGSETIYGKKGVELRGQKVNGKEYYRGNKGR